jgi:hypothetical protein
MRVCSEPGCPTLIPKAGRCAEHARAHDKARGSRQQRGYGSQHTALRREWSPKVATGTIKCWRCGQYIRAGQPWDLGHDDTDRTKYQGPEHANQCNRAAAGRASHGLPPRTTA